MAKLKKNNETKRNSMDKLPGYKMFMPTLLSVFMVIFPFIVAAVVIPPQVGASVAIEGESLDIMIYCKEFVLVAFAAVALCWLIGENIFPDNIVREVPIRDNNKLLYILASVVIAAVVMSAILSEHSAVVLFGLPTECEGALAVISYVILFFVVYNNFHYDKAISILEIGLLVLTAILIVLSAVEFLYKPYVMLSPVSDFIKLFVSAEHAKVLEFVDDRNRVVLAFSNSDYYGGFCAILFPFIYELWIGAKTMKKQILMSVLSVGMVFCVVVSKSSLAFYLMVIELVVLTIYEFKNIISKIFELSIMLVIFAVFMIGMDIASDGLLVELSKVSITNNDSYDENEQEKYLVSDIVMKDDRIIIKGEDNSFSIVNAEEGIMFCDENDEILNVEVTSDGWLTMESDEYEGVATYISTMTDGSKRVCVEIELGYKETVDFYIVNGKFKGVGANGIEVADIDADTKTIQKLNSAFTGRGYGWMKTLPILKSTILLGKGSGNFPYYFEQYDYVGLLKTHGSHKIIMDKPHNMFLQYAVDIGVVGTVAMYGLVIVVLISGMKLLLSIKSSEEKSRYIYIGSYVAVAGFIIYSMLNDGVVSVTPYLWLFLGVNKSLQYKYKKA